MTYKIKLTKDDIDAVFFSAERYGWSKALWGLIVEDDASHSGCTIKLAEHEAWELMDACEEDCWLLPLLSPESNLYAELHRLREEVV